MQIFFPTEMMDMGISIAGKSKFLFYTITDIRTGLEDCHFGRKAKMAFKTPVLTREFNLIILGAVVFSLFIIYDTHMIMRRLSPEEYIFAAINLYLDIINLFLHILKMLSRDQR